MSLDLDFSSNFRRRKSNPASTENLCICVAYIYHLAELRWEISFWTRDRSNRWFSADERTRVTVKWKGEGGAREERRRCARRWPENFTKTTTTRSGLMLRERRAISPWEKFGTPCACIAWLIKCGHRTRTGRRFLAVSRSPARKRES